MQEVTTRQTCRVCDGPLQTVFTLGDLYVSTFLDDPQQESLRAPLEVVQCLVGKCGLVQLRHTAPQELMYTGHYWYKSATSPVIVSDLADIADKTALLLKPSDEQRIWIDIGANDGTLFKFVDGNQFLRIGVEPAGNLQAELDQCADSVFECFWEDYTGYKAHIITAIGMFYDSEDPNKFIANVKKHLEKDGIFVSQLMTLAPMLRKNDLGNICHEHLEYYSFQALRNLFERNGLEIFRVEENEINGGSYRLYARHFAHGSLEYGEIATDLLEFKQRVDANKNRVVAFVREARSAGKRIYGYGASTKGNTVLQYYGLTDKDLDGIADKNPEKWEKYTVGTKISIVSEEEARKKADYFLILPFAFTKAFLEREAEWMAKGGKFIVGTPEFKIYETLG